MPADRSATYQLQTQQGKWVGAAPLQKGHATIAGRVYPVVKLPNGSVWMASNLIWPVPEAAILRDYSELPDMKSVAFWQFDEATYLDRGLFYNAPAFVFFQAHIPYYFQGWHVPTYSELHDAMQDAAINKGLFEAFNLTAGYGNLLASDENHGWYEDRPDTVTPPRKSYILPDTQSSNTIYACCYIDETSSGKTLSGSTAWSYSHNYHLPIRLVMDDPSQFVPETTETWNARTRYTRYWRPKITFEFSESDFNPIGKGLYNSAYDNGRNWTKVSDSPNRWTLEVNSKNRMVSTEDMQYGLAYVCSTHSQSSIYGLLTPTHLGTCTCKIVDFDTMDNIETMDRSFVNCTGLTQIPSSIQFGSYVANVAQMFAGCTEVTGGALDLYNQLKDVATITNHADTFKDCGLNTVTGLAELQQIPLSWGGLLAPPSTTMNCIRVAKVKWSCGSTAPDWSTNPELYVFTSSSVSDYAGVNMKRSNTVNTQNNFATSGAEAYYRIAFVQFASGTSGAITWALTTSGYNGKLDASATAGDMPGTLSYDNYGVTDLHYGTYDSSKQVYFCFLVTNVAPDSWQGLSDAYALQGNNFYKATQDIKWFTD